MTAMRGNQQQSGCQQHQGRTTMRYSYLQYQRLRHKQQKGQQAFEAFHKNSLKTTKICWKSLFFSLIDKYIYQLTQNKFLILILYNNYSKRSAHCKRYQFSRTFWRSTSFCCKMRIWWSVLRCRGPRFMMSTTSSSALRSRGQTSW